ncbi:MAG: CRISPR-associated protein Cas4 [Acidobacteria bacterium 13_1_20CM_3_53_8]|nr:MAG: CRISPR-associated protein Cas4 [Acidobacteria bacterium 13_1_20CM_3_53_8]
MSTSTPDSPPSFTGTEVGYYFICPKKLWWFAHGVQMERESDRVRMGKLVHEESYQRRRKELNIDDRIVLDWREDGVIHEVKLTDKMEEAHEMQLLYYLYYLKCKGVEGLRGQIDYPKLRETKEVELTEEKEKEIEKALVEMRRIVSSRKAPEVEWMKICGKCAYAELCWG